MPAVVNRQKKILMFFTAHRFVSVRTEFVTGETPVWCILVEFVQQSESLAKSSGKIDYMFLGIPFYYFIFFLTVDFCLSIF